MKTVTVRVPGSTSNLGSGFDTLGLAVNRYSFLTLTRTNGSEFTVESASGSGASKTVLKILREASSYFFKTSGKKPFGLTASLEGNLPPGRGLGASATARVGILLALNELTQTGLDSGVLLQMATYLEHHPDNASPALFGGFTVSGLVNDRVQCLHFPVSSRIKLVTLIPEFQIDTERARKLMPKEYSKADAAHALNRAALISAAFVSGQYELLRGVFDDRFHQPYRERLLPQLSKVIRAGQKAGAVGGWLSGSGSAIMCLTLQKAEQICEAMHRVLPKSEMHILRAENRAAEVWC
ncbi:MAG TPA: homoserine kinase [Verrucomicrobiae bacterium]